MNNSLSARLVKIAALPVLAIASISAGFLLRSDTYWRLNMGALAVVFGLVAIVIHLNNSFLSLAALVSTAVVYPYQFGGGERAPLNSSGFVAAVICCLWLLSVALRPRRPFSGRRPVFVAVALMTVATISFLAGQASTSSASAAPIGAQIAQLIIFLVSLSLFSITADLIGDVARLKRLTFLFLACASVACIVHIAPTRLLPAVLEFLVKAVSPGTVGSVFWTWMVALSASQAVFNRNLGPGWRLALGVLTALAVFRGLFLARSWISGWLPPLITIFFVFVFRFPRLTVILALLAALAIMPFVTEVTALTPSQEEYSAVTRVEAARVLWPLIKSNPILGMGPANYYYHVSSTPILGWYVRFNSHNQYLDLAAQLGALGTLVFVWLMFEIAREAWLLRRHFRGDFGEAYLIAAMAGLAGTVVSGGLADWILPFYYNVGFGGLRSSLLFWVFAGGVAVFARSARIETAPDVLGAGITRSKVEPWDATTVSRV